MASVIGASTACFEQHGFGQWTLWRGDEEGPIGFCGVRFIEDSPEIELLYGLAPAHWGQGLATEASRGVLAYGFQTLGLERILARADEANRASIRVMQRLGMSFEREEERDGKVTVTYALSREDQAWRV